MSSSIGSACSYPPAERFSRSELASASILEAVEFGLEFIDGIRLLGSTIWVSLLEVRAAVILFARAAGTFALAGVVLLFCEELFLAAVAFLVSKAMRVLVPLYDHLLKLNLELLWLRKGHLVVERF